MPRTTFKFKVESFSSLNLAPVRRTYMNHYALINVRNLPDLSEWREINPRDSKLTGMVPKAITESFINNETFVFQNRGLCLTVHSVFYNHKTEELEVTLTNKALHGLLDGGHTYAIVKKEIENLQPNDPQFIKVEFLENFDHDDIVDIVGARNTSNQLKEKSLFNSKGYFDELKEELSGETYFNKIAWSENEQDENGKVKPIDVSHIIAMMTAFDMENYNEHLHPIHAYSGKAKCLEQFKNNQANYSKIVPLVKDILILHDLIYMHFGSMFNEWNKKYNGKKNDTFGKLASVTNCTLDGDVGPRMHFIENNADFKLPDAFIYPVLAAFRACVIRDKKTGNYQWDPNMNVIKELSKNLGIELVGVVGEEALKNQNPNKVGKTKSVWSLCYAKVENTLARRSKQIGQYA